MSEQLPAPIPFFDWYGIWAGHGGVGRDGLSWIQDPPAGDLQLRVQQATLAPLNLAAERPWEAGGITPNLVMEHDGVLKMWYRSMGDDGTLYIAYAESADDGMTWERPELGLVEYGGSSANNLLHTNEHFALHCVFVDPSAPPEERYKSVITGGRVYIDGELNTTITKPEVKEMRRAMQHEGFSPDKIAEKIEIRQVIWGAVSPDGLRWTKLEEPVRDLGSKTLDGGYDVHYDAERDAYIAIHRGHLERRRSIRRSVGRAFDDWEEPRFMFAPDPQDPIDVDVYASCYCRYPGGGDRHLMFLPFYHRRLSTVDIQLATSRDGELWSRPERVPIIPRGQYDSIYGLPQLVPHGPDEWGLLLVATHHRHDFKTYTPEEGEKEVAEPPATWHWAKWKRDRLVALTAEGEAQFTMVQRVCHGSEMRMNFATERGGWVRVELVYTPQTPPQPVEAYPGFGLEEADPLVGDDLSRVVTWKGCGDLSSLKGKEVSIRIHMARARLFSIAI